jgi:FAD/FMN-containing dehydrogenase
MRRRFLLAAAALAPLFHGLAPGLALAAQSGAAPTSGSRIRVRPGDSAWPSPEEWQTLSHAVEGRLFKPQSPFVACGATPAGAACGEALAHLQNPYYIGDQPALTQSSGWVDAWTSQPSVYAVSATTAQDVVATVGFARKHNLRLVIKGGGHSYQGTSTAPDSLLLWMRGMNNVTVQDAFVAHGCAQQMPPQPAVTVGAGAMWIDAYDAVTTRGGRYVQGGGCTTVGVAGLVQSGGFNSFSKTYGTAAGALLEAEVVTADGVVRIANPCTNPDLFWGIKGGGGGSLGVLTRLTLRTRELPKYFGAVVGAIKASSDDAYKALIAQAIGFYNSALFNPHWGERMTLTDRVLHLTMLFQGLDPQQVHDIWAPFFSWVTARREYSFDEPVRVLSFPAEHFWDGEYLRKNAPGVMAADDRPNAPRNHVLYAEDRGEVGWFIHGYQSAWLPASLLGASRQPQLVEALFNATRHWAVELFFSKGLAGAPAGEIAAARNTATHPNVLDAFALAICSGSGHPAFPGMPGGHIDLASARDHAGKIGKAVGELLRVAPGAGSYVAESDYFKADWQTGFWGSNYPKLAAVKRKYDPDGLFFVHHGVGSENWSADGFTRLGG